MLITADNYAQLATHSGVSLIVPICKRTADVPLCMQALLPIYSYNRHLIGFLKSCPAGAFIGHRVVVGIFAADSFLPFADLQRALKRVGIKQVTNFPTVSAYGVAVEKTLMDVGLGFARECAVLSRFRKQGFETATVIREVEHRTAVEDDENFALIELAQSDTQVFSKLFARKLSAQRLFMTPNASRPESGPPPNVDGLILSADNLC